MKALEYGLGDFVAELEVPDSVARVEGRRGHVDLEGTTAELLIGLVQTVHPVRFEGRVKSP